MERKAFREDIANEEDGVNIHKDKGKTLDRNAMKIGEGERYPTQAREKEFEVKLHFSEQEMDGGAKIDQELIRVLKDIYIMRYLEERRTKDR